MIKIDILKENQIKLKDNIAERKIPDLCDLKDLTKDIIIYSLLFTPHQLNITFLLPFFISTRRLQAFTRATLNDIA